MRFSPLPGFLLLTLFTGLLLAFGPLYLSNGTLRMLTDFLLLLSAAQLWNLLAGYGGLVSIGQHAFTGAGAYCFFGFAVLAGVNAWLSLILALVFGALLAIPVFALLIRLRQAYFAIGSWVVAETLSLLAGKLPGFGGGSGLSFPPDIIRHFGAQVSVRISTVYWLALLVCFLILVGMIFILHSRFGLALKAMRDNETAALAMGVNPGLTKLYLFMISGAFLGLIGAINTLQKLRISPGASFSLQDWTVYVIFICVIGGMGRFLGPVIGAIVFMLLREQFSGFGPVYMLILGASAVVVMLLEPRGIIHLFERGWRFIRGYLPLQHLKTTSLGL